MLVAVKIFHSLLVGDMLTETCERDCTAWMVRNYEPVHVGCCTNESDRSITHRDHEATLQALGCIAGTPLYAIGYNHVMKFFLS